MEQDPPKGRPFSRTLLELAVGAVVGFAVCSFGGPSLIAWWYEPPSGDAFSCAGTVRVALTQFVTMQLVFAASGGAGTALSLFFIRRALRKGTAKGTPGS